jgi:sRNA-binding regulator protein Hfq
VNPDLGLQICLNFVVCYLRNGMISHMVFKHAT